MNERIRILCVDDEPNVLEGLALHLRRRYDIALAESGAAGLELLQKDPSFAIVMSDMRMPGMDGATFLSRSRQIAPDAVRMLLTGQTELESAVAAVNEGQIFRFLTKPCPPPALLVAVDAAAAQHRLITAERVLLEQTLHGSIKTLTDVLALTSPASFGRATRIKRRVSELANALGLRERWQLEVAAMLSQLGLITLPAETVEKVHYGQPLTAAEQAMLARAPAVTEQLLGNIPRLEGVRGILSASSKPYKRNDARGGSEDLVERGAHILKVAADFDALEGQGESIARVVGIMRGRVDRYAPEVLDALSRLHSGAERLDDVRELPLAAVRVGMVFAEDVKLTAGPLLVARGYEVTRGFVERARNFSAGMVKEPVRVIVRDVGPDTD
ncbi:MAG: response regulator [Archangium sp.]|nr:response regulator [Archangium sp.]